MCLTLRKKNSRKPYNKSRIRYKKAKFPWNWDSYDRSKITAPYMDTEYKTDGKWMRAHFNDTTFDGYEEGFGFHVFLTERDVRDHMRANADRKKDGFCILKVEVRGFQRSGIYGLLRSETWSQMRILKVI